MFKFSLDIIWEQLDIRGGTKCFWAWQWYKAPHTHPGRLKHRITSPIETFGSCLSTQSTHLFAVGCFVCPVNASLKRQIRQMCIFEDVPLFLELVRARSLSFPALSLRFRAPWHLNTTRDGTQTLMRGGTRPCKTAVYFQNPVQEHCGPCPALVKANPHQNGRPVQITNLRTKAKQKGSYRSPMSHRLHVDDYWTWDPDQGSALSFRNTI